MPDPLKPVHGDQIVTLYLVEQWPACKRCGVQLRRPEKYLKTGHDENGLQIRRFRCPSCGQKTAMFVSPKKI